MTRERLRRALGPWVVGALVLAVSARASAASVEGYEVDADVDVERGRVVEHVAVRARVEEGEDRVRLWLYGDRLAVAPSAMDERSARWIYPGEVALGGYAIERVRVDDREASYAREALGEHDPPRPDRAPLRARDLGGSDLVVAIDPGPARVVTIRVDATLEVPERFGRLAHATSRLALAGPWYPLLLGEDDAVEDARHVVVARFSGGRGVSVEGALSATLHVDRVLGYVPLLAGDDLEARSSPLGGERRLVVVDRRDAYVPPARGAPGVEGLDDVTAIDRVAAIRAAALDVLATARWLGLELPDPLVVFVVPSRTELAASAPGVVLVSDRVFQIFPLDELRELHRRALRRALFQLAAQALARVDSAADRAWSVDLRAAALEALDERRRHGSRERTEALLEPFSFHPAVDQLINAPQITFDDVYFGAIDEPDRFRDDPSRARFPFARGRRLLASIEDVLGEGRMQRLVAMLVHGRRSVRSALERASPGASARLATWTAYPSLEVNYRLGPIESERIEAPEERPDAPRWRHRVVVLRDGDERPEPVEVEVEDEHGERVVGVWDGPGREGVVVIETRGERRRVVLDPRLRVSESGRVSEGHPRADDASSPTWRLPLFNNFSVDVLASEGNVTGLADISLRPRYDLEHLLILRLARTIARTTGRVRYLEGLGPRVTDNRRMIQLGGGLAFSRVEPGFATSTLGGYALELELLGTLSTERFIADPREGVTAIVSLAGGGTLRDDGSSAFTARGSLRVSGIVPVGLLDAFFFLGAGGFTAGSALDADRQMLGGRYGLRGFANDELVGDAMLFVVAEHRHTLIGDLAINLLHAVWVREVQLVTWLGAGAVFGTTDGREARVAAEAGAGLRFHYEYGGVQPGLLALDVGVPVSRLAEESGAPHVARSPVAFYVSFDQYF